MNIVDIVYRLIERFIFLFEVYLCYFYFDFFRDVYVVSGCVFTSCASCSIGEFVNFSQHLCLLLLIQLLNVYICRNLYTL